MDILISVAAKIAEYTVAPVGRQLAYLFFYKTNVDNLTQQMDDLRNAKARLQDRVNEATNNCEQIYEDVESWLRRFDEVSLEADTLLNHDDHAKVVCSCRSFPHLRTRHQLSRKAKKMSIRVSKLSEQNTFDVVACRPQIESSFSMRDYETFDSRKAVLEDLMVAVRDADRSRIGLYGMGGIGKTMLATEIARRAQEEKLFSKVVLAPISQIPNLKEIQQYIADMLELKFGETDNSLGKRAKLLEQRLKPENKILLILDDVWRKLELKEIGIHDDCKMLLTTRNGEVLSNYMEIAENNIFNIEVLAPEEAINLFEKIIGDKGDHPLAHQIVNECGGLPICIATVAHALKCIYDSHRWKDALEQLRSSTFIGIDGMNDKVYSSIRMSYDFLGSHKEAKSLLLICALHREDAEIGLEGLTRCSVGCRLIRGVSTMKDARNRVNTLVDILKSRCLLFDGERKSYVKMHDVIRDVCISIAKENEHRLNNITNANMYGDFVKDETNKESKAISFLSYDDYKLPPKLECPSLELLLMSGLSFKSIPDDFFGQTRKLEALQMDGKYHTLLNSSKYVESLPASFRSLQNIQTLCLRRTFLEDIVVIGELKSLKVLDLSESIFIKLLPKEIGQLQHLQLLDLRECNGLKVIEPNVISNLTQMEELYLPSKFMAWETKEGSMEERKNASVQEIKSLQQLTILYLSVQSINVLSKELFTEKLETYRISIGSTYFDFFRDETDRWLHLTLSKLDEINTFGLNSLIKRSENLLIEGLEDITNVVDDLDEDGFPTLKYLRLGQLPLLEGICSHGNLRACSFNELRKVSLPNLTDLQLYCCKRIEYVFCFGMAERLLNLKDLRVYDCEAMKCILKGSKTGEDTRLPHNTILLPKLVTIVLENLPALKTLVSIGDDEGNTIPIPKYAFNGMIAFFNLKELTVSECDNLKYLLSFAMAESLVQLEELQIKWCKNIEEVIASDEESGGSRSIIFEKLQTLELYDLPKALEFISSNSIGKKECPLSEEMGMGMVASKQSFFKDKVSLPNLPCLNLEKLDRIEYLFCFGMAQRLLNLKELEVRDCEAMKCIVKGSKTGEDTPLPHNTILLPKLVTLELKKLPALKTLVSIGDDEGNTIPIPKYAFNGMIAFSNLKELNVSECDNLIYLLTFDMAQSLVQLEKLNITSCKNIEEVIVGNEESSGSKSIIFEKLQTLELDDLPNLVKFWEEDCIECPLWSELLIEDCPKVLEFTSSNYSMGKKECPPSEKMGMVAASKQSFFKDKITFPNLKELTVTKGKGFWDMMEGIEEIGMVAVPEQRLFNEKVIFPNLQKLKTDWCEGIFEMSSECCPTISRFPNLAKLDVTCSFRNKSIVVSDVMLFLHKNHNIHTLRLEGSSFVDGHQHQQPADNELSNTTTPKADGVNDLFEGPSQSMAFHKLETLIVLSFCDSLTCLLGTSTAASLPQLKQMRIYNCKGMRVVISDDEQAQPEPLTQLVFHTLNSLTLYGLPNLKSFYSGHKLMSFPNLKELEIIGCPKMEKFSHKLTSTSASFNKITVNYREEEIRDGDVNKTITKLWEDKCHLFTQQKDDDDDDDDDDDEVFPIVRTRSQGQLRTCESSRGSCSKA